MKERINEVKKRVKEATGKEITDEEAIYILKGEKNDSDFNCKQEEDIEK